MKILLTGGGTGGHFYPIIAVAEALYDLAEEDKIITPQLIFMSDQKYDGKLVADEGLIFKKIYAGKIRRYFSFLNVTDLFKTFLGILKAIWSIYMDMPDVIFGKGGYASFPVLVAGRIFGIPVIIHESDAIPGKVNKWAGKFAKKIALSFPEAVDYFPKEKSALTGIPIRKNVLGFTPEEGREMFGLEPKIPTLLILGGSQGCQKINEIILDAMEELLKDFQIIHQCGKNNEKEISERAEVVLEKSDFKSRYHPYPYLNDSFLRNAASVADLVISRAGGSAIYEIAAWGLPSILVPLKNSAQGHQMANAYNYNRSGACDVIEESNLSPHVLISEIKRIFEEKEKMKKMAEAAKKFYKPEAARKIAKEIMKLALEHA
ncbi:undecaprenyldiphospho-muramoylpentapeptide beta-N-acetylglucosaminyltransferase [Patescibacteria group bacterium]|nr:undecaprenyldiphospho-muramoylpentapeptide beta-N-acetylglucosaminyltransferase [Patescibacteria group bacterium]